MESMSTAFMPCMVFLRSFLITPCSWKAWRVVRRSDPVPYVRASLLSASHCLGEQTPPGRRVRIMKL